MYGVVVSKSARRVVEREVSIFADAYERDIDGRGGERFAGTTRHASAGSASTSSRCTAVIPVLSISCSRRYAAETGGMIRRNPDVLVEMEHLDAAPSRFPAGR